MTSFRSSHVSGHRRDDPLRLRHLGNLHALLGGVPYLGPAQEDRPGPAKRPDAGDPAGTSTTSGATRQLEPTTPCCRYSSRRGHLYPYLGTSSTYYSPVPADFTLLDYKTGFVTVCFVFACGLLIGLMAHFGATDVCGTYAATRVVTVYTILLIVPASVYIRNRHLRITLWHEISSLCRRQ